MKWEIDIFHFMAAKRVFVAIAIPESARGIVARAVEKLRRSDADVRWVPAKNYHVTLKFLGEMEDAPLVRLTEGLRRIAMQAVPLTLTFGEPLLFPSIRRPRVAAVGFRGDVEILKKLAGEIEGWASQCGVAPERRGFAGHLTIGRIKSPRNLSALQQSFSKWACDGAGEMRIESFHLYESTLLPQGAEYNAIETYGLGAGRINSPTSQGS